MGSCGQNGANFGRKCGSDCLTVVSFVAENAGYPKVPVSLLARTSSSVSRQRDALSARETRQSLGDFLPILTKTQSQVVTSDASGVTREEVSWR